MRLLIVFKTEAKCAKDVYHPSELDREPQTVNSSSQVFSEQ